MDVSRKTGKYYAGARTEMLEFVPIDARKILDIGCASGVFSALVKKERNANVWGIEIEVDVAAQAQTKIDTVLVGNVIDLLEELPEKYFDCIVCNDVLEHLVDPYLVISALKRKLSDAGVIVFSLPNVRYFDNLWNLLVNKDWQYQDAGILDRTHLRFFTEKSIRRMFDELDYELVTMRGLRPKHSLKFILLNTVFLGHLSDTRYLQFAGVAKPRQSNIS